MSLCLHPFSLIRLSLRSVRSSSHQTFIRRGPLYSTMLSSDTVSLAPAAVNPAEQQESDTLTSLVMQIVVRRDLLDAEGWGVGPLMAQVAHATAAVLHETRGLPETQAYLEDLKNMRKAVLQTTNQASLQKLSDLLSASTPPVPHHLWIEQPENVPTCIAIAPNRRDTRIKKALDKSSSRLWKG